MEKRSKFIYAIFAVGSILIFLSCDSYHSRMKLITELSSLYDDNHAEFAKIHEYFLRDSLSRGLVFRYQDGKIGIGVGSKSTTIDSIEETKDDLDIYQILTFMKKEKIRIISGNGKEGWINITLKNDNSTCSDFWYRSDFNPDDENVKREIENINNTKTKNWIYILDKKGWYVRGVKCF